MTMVARTLLDEWKEEKYLRHYTIAHVLRTINWRWFEREGERENQANHKILLVTTYKKRREERERERDLRFRMFRLCHRMHSRAPRCIEFVRRHGLTSPPVWLTLSLSFLFFLISPPLSLFIWFGIKREYYETPKKKKINARFHMLKSKKKWIRIVKRQK